MVTPPSAMKVAKIPTISDIAPSNNAPIAPPPIAIIVQRLITLPLNSSVSWSCAADCIVVAKKVVANPNIATRIAVRTISFDNPTRMTQIGTRTEHTAPLKTAN